MTAKRFRIAFSFAGEKRDFVAEVAGILAMPFGEDHILYDKTFEAEFARSDLGIQLPELYHNESDLVVLVICKDYENKDWCGLEWAAIHALIKERRAKDVMLCRFDRALIKGLYSTAGFVELDHKTAEQCARLILERLADNEGHPKNYYTKAFTKSGETPRTFIPNNLPRPQPFFGRIEELKHIAEALDPESRTWGALIDGPGGMGKTSLAVRAAYDCPPGQFQRIIFLSVKDRELDDDGERQLGDFILPGFLEMLNELARELEKPDIMKAPENERIRLILAALGPAKALLILDNLESLTKEDRDELFTFITRLPQGCKAILTSREPFGSSTDVLVLEKLDQESALDCIAEVAKRNTLLAKTKKADRLRLYKQTDGKPLLLRWTAGQLGRGSCRTIADALEFIRSCPTDNNPLEFIFGDLSKEFTLDEEKVLVALTYLALPAKVEHISNVIGPAVQPVETALRTLANRAVIVPNKEETAFTLVPMVAEFLRRSRPELVAEIGTMLEQRAYALILENGYSKNAPFKVLDATWPTVAPTLPLFVAGPNDQLQTVCTGLRYFFEYTGRWDEWLSLEQLAEARTVAVGDYLKAGWRAYFTGWIHFLRWQVGDVLACADRAEIHWRTAQAGVRERAFAIRLHAIGHTLRKDYSAAIAAFREALDLHRTSSVESQDVATSLDWIGNAERTYGDLVAAEEDYREALRVARAIHYTEGEALTTGNLARLALDREQWLDAETYAREALQLSEKLGQRELIACNCRRLAIALARQGKKVEALPYAERAVAVFTRLGSPNLKSARETLRDCED